MGGWLRQLALNAQVRAGLSAAIVVWAVIAALALALALIFLLLAAFIWLADRYDSVLAGLVLGLFFVLLALIAGLACIMLRRGNIERARVELELRQRESAGVNLFDPKLLAMGYQVGQAIGWRRLASLAAVGLLAAAIAKEWRGHTQTTEQETKPGDS